MVDIHSHILPEVDDGASSSEIAVAMCRMAAADGLDHMVATPHANDEYQYDRGRHSESLQRLQETIGPLPALILGCDFHLSFENLQDVLAHPERYVIGDTRYLLVELSDFIPPRQAAHGILRLLEAGLHPILTHPERNPMLQREPNTVLDWAERGCIVQVTAASINGLWGKGIAQLTHWFIERQAAHVVATDAHNLGPRAPVLSAARNALAQRYGTEFAQVMVDRNPRAIINNLPLPYFPHPIR